MSAPGSAVKYAAAAIAAARPAYMFDSRAREQEATASVAGTT